MVSARPKYNKKTALALQASKLWRECCWELYGDKCELCGRAAGQMHHIIFRSKSRNLMYDILNGIPVCERCHNKLHHSVGPRTNEEYLVIIFKRRGQWQRDYLEKNTRVTGVYTVKWLKEQIDYLKEIKNKLNIR